MHTYCLAVEHNAVLCTTLLPYLFYFENEYCFKKIFCTLQDTSARTAVISAQPQLRNMTAEVTKFMPTSLRVRRNHPKPSTSKLKPAVPTSAPPIKSATKANHPPTQGDAYDAFMREMQGLF